jgi:hypothetical protein
MLKIIRTPFLITLVSFSSLIFTEPNDDQFDEEALQFMALYEEITKRPSFITITSLGAHQTEVIAILREVLPFDKLTPEQLVETITQLPFPAEKARELKNELTSAGATVEVTVQEF